MRSFVLNISSDYFGHTEQISPPLGKWSNWDRNQLGGRSSAAASLQFITRSGSASKTKLRNYHCFDSFFLLASGKL